ncbi:hypothetical protein BURPS668_A2755 [Burkholderia pseudomallei 668]|nr:hypothetical protein BURPS668_A2755 [Burkholderia pseudomallei 668]
MLDSGARRFGAVRARRGVGRIPGAGADAARVRRRLARGGGGGFIARSGTEDRVDTHVKPDRCAPLDRGQRRPTKQM